MTDEHRVSLREALATGAVLDLVLLGFAGTVLDGGVVLALALCLAAGHWAGAAMVILRRPRAMTSLDAAFVRFGLLALIVAAVGVGFVASLILP